MFIKRLFRNKCGSVFILVGLSISTLVTVYGISIDIGISMLTKNKAQQAVDSAVLAGAINLGSISNDVDLDNVINRYFSMNFPEGYMGSMINSTNVNRTIDRSNNTVALDVSNARAETFFSNFWGTSDNRAINFDVAAQAGGGGSTIVPADVAILVERETSMHFNSCSNSYQCPDLYDFIPARSVVGDFNHHIDQYFMPLVSDPSSQTRFGYIYSDARAMSHSDYHQPFSDTVSDFAFLRDNMLSSAGYTYDYVTYEESDWVNELNWLPYFPELTTPDNTRRKILIYMTDGYKHTGGTPGNYNVHDSVFHERCDDLHNNNVEFYIVYHTRLRHSHWSVIHHPGRLASFEDCLGGPENLKVVENRTEMDTVFEELVGIINSNTSSTITGRSNNIALSR